MAAAKLKNIKYILRPNHKAKHIRLTVYCDSRVVLTLPRSLNIFDAEKFLFKKLDWVLNKLAYFKTYKRLPKHKATREEFLRSKNEALNRVKQKVTQINQYYGFKIGKITIRNQLTRWGSCSKKGNLNFNFKVLYLSEDLLNYLVTHELCHLSEFNHSKKFWFLVAQKLPNYKLLRKKLAHWSKTETLL